MITIPSPSAILVIWIIVLTVLACVILSVVVTLSSRKAEAYDVYDLIEPFAKNIKITLQMFIGFGLTGLIILKILHQLQWSINNTFLNDFVYMSSTLAIVAAALAYSSAIELAYTLFTKGPDEAVDPLMLGLAAAILLSISKTEVFDVTFGEAMAFYVAGLAGLFAIKRFFIDSKATQKADAAAPQPLLAIRRFFDDLRNTQKASSTATQRPSTLL